MKKEQIGTVTLSALLLSLVLTACGNDPSGSVSTSADGSPENAQAAPADERANEETDWQNIRSFSESIEWVSLNYEEESKTANLSLNYRNLDVLDKKGRPVLSQIRDLKGTLANDGTAILTSERESDIQARLTCQDMSCQNAEVELTKSSGTITGTAKVNRTRFERLKLFNGSWPNDFQAGSTQAHAVKALNSSDPRVAHLVITEVQDGMSFFNLSIQFSNESWSPQDKDYFVEKVIGLSGAKGKYAKVTLSYGSSKDHTSVGYIDNYLAKVDLSAAENYYVSIHFYQNLISGEVEESLFLRAGRNLL